MTTATPTTYALLGMLATRPWTGYELTRQVRRSLRFVWSVSEGHLYREQRRLVALGWATVSDESAGRRTRKRYAITEAGRQALAAWMATPPEEPHFQIEGVLRAFYGDVGVPEDLALALRATSESARRMLDELSGFAAEYLAEDGPMQMLESGTGGPEDRREHRGRTMFPERLPAVALAVDVTTELLGVLDRYFAEAAKETAAWPDRAPEARHAQTRARLQAASRRRPSVRPEESPTA